MADLNSDLVEFGVDEYAKSEAPKKSAKKVKKEEEK